jgi:signal transduction histidine kinase
MDFRHWRCGTARALATHVASRVPIRYFLASLVLLVALVAGHAVTSARRTQAELRGQLADRGLALAEAFEASSRNAIRSNALVEEMIAERLFDNARLVDEMLRRPVLSGEIELIARRNHLRKIDLLDLEGRPWAPPLPPAHGEGSWRPMPGPGVMRGHMMGRPWGPTAERDSTVARETGAPPDAPESPDDTRMGGAPVGRQPNAPLGSDRPMMRFMWGRRWGRPAEPAEGAPSSIRDRKFWEGTDFGVATGARSFRGIIAVHADAESILTFRREIGVERQLEELGRQPGVTRVALLGSDLTIVAHSDPRRVGTRVADPGLAQALAERRSVSRIVERAPGTTVLETVRPLAVDGGQVGLLAIDFSTDPMDRAWQRDVRAALWLGAAVLGLGVAGMGLIFWTQQRHLRELSALEAEMERRERLAALGDVAAAFAHEVRNPLNAVSMGLQRLASEFVPEPAEEYGRFVSMIEGEVRRLNAIVEQFIALARPLPLEPARVALDDLYAELAVLLEPEARRAGVTLAVDAGGVTSIVADRDHLQQVLLNLVLNAIQATGSGGRVTIGAERARDGIVLTVADTGPGIPPEVLPRVFDPYFTTKRGGLGLGLTIARRIVEAHGGAIDVESQVGPGTRFRVRLPEREQ